MKKSIVKKLLMISLLSTSLTYATVTSEEKATQNEVRICLSETCLSTERLQEEVEKRILEGTLPFEMGLELIKRWSNNQVTA